MRISDWSSDVCSSDLYVATAERFCAFLSEHRGGAVDASMLATLGANDLRAYLAVRRDDGLGHASAARDLSALRGFLRLVGASHASVPPTRRPTVRPARPHPAAPATPPAHPRLSTD